MKKVLTLSLILTILLFQSTKAKDITVTSPDKKITVNINLAQEIVFNIKYMNSSVLEKGTISLDLLNEMLGNNPKLISIKKQTIDEMIHPVVPLKNNKIRNHCNVLNLYFKNNYQLEFRVFNNGVSYRFITTKKEEITVVNESSTYQFADNYNAYLSKTARTFSNYENVYQPIAIKDFKKEDVAVIPLFLDTEKSKILIMEADLHDYPAMFLEGTGGNSLHTWFPKSPEKTEPLPNSSGGDRRLKISKEADYIAKTIGTRSFPWRIFAIAEEDKDIATNDLVYLIFMV